MFAAKIPNHQGLTLTSDVQVSLDAESIELTRSGSGLSMKLQANDCATGGIFQMEPARADARPTVFTHVLGNEVFYFDNPNFRTHLNEQFPCVGCNGAVNDLVTVTARVNFGNDFSRNFVGRDSPQAATRITPAGCPNTIPNAKNPGTVDHCGGESQWSVQSGGRMGQVMGEDATEVAPAAKTCTQNCQAQDRIRGRATVLGFPFPVPDPVRLKPRFPAGFVVP